MSHIDYQGEVYLLENGTPRALFWGPGAVADAERIADLLTSEEGGREGSVDPGP